MYCDGRGKPEGAKGYGYALFLSLKLPQMDLNSLFKSLEGVWFIIAMFPAFMLPMYTWAMSMDIKYAYRYVFYGEKSEKPEIHNWDQFAKETSEQGTLYLAISMVTFLLIVYLAYDVPDKEIGLILILVGIVQLTYCVRKYFLVEKISKELKYSK